MEKDSICMPTTTPTNGLTPGGHGLGWRVSIPDARDLYYSYPMGVPVPDSLDWRDEFLPPILDQDGAGSCTSFAGKYALQYADHFAGQPTEDISELFQYYMERVIEHSTGYDAGAEMRDIFKAMKKYGMVPEEKWPYDVSKVTAKPPADVIKLAKADRIQNYMRVHQVRSLLQACLAAKRTFLVGISVYQSFENVGSDGMVPMPDLSRESLLGGHAVCCVGYRNSDQRYIFLNSWGSSWGAKGCFYLPYQYVEDSNLAGDIWTLTRL